MKQDSSKSLISRGQKVMPGGVSSPVRAFRAVGGTPPFMRRASGSRLWDVDGNEYIDYVGSWGPAILGHAHPEVLEAVQKAAVDGLTFGAPTEREIELAETIIKLVPSIEKVRLVSSGTEATMSAIRVARAATGRAKILKFAGCYHGHADAFLVKAGSGVMTLGLPDSPGVPEAVAALTVTVNYNDLAAVEAALASREIACVCVEPVVGNMGLLMPRAGYLEGLRRACDETGTLLLFDEVMTGFRVSLGGAQARFGIRPDLTTLGKVVGGGMPLAAYGGRNELMKLVAPEGPVYQAGTLSGNPLATAAGLKTLELLQRPGVYEQLERRTQALCAGVARAAEASGVPFYGPSIGSMFTGFFAGHVVDDEASARKCDTARFGRYHHAMLERGVYLAPSQFEAGFVSLAHSEADIEATVSRAAEALRASA